MKKWKKGTPGYITYKKRVESIKALLSFSLALAVLGLGIWQTGTRLNLLTVFAILGTLPACKLLVGVITRLPYSTIPKKEAEEIAVRTSGLFTAYDLIITSTEKIMPLDCVVLDNKTIIGYTRNEKVDPIYLAQHMKNMLVQNNFKKPTVKIYKEYRPFLARLDEWKQQNEVLGEEERETAENMRHLILNISL